MLNSKNLDFHAILIMNGDVLCYCTTNLYRYAAPQEQLRMDTVELAHFKDVNEAEVVSRLHSTFYSWSGSSMKPFDLWW